MPQLYELTGELTDGRNLVLDVPLPLPPGRVRVIVEQLAAALKPDLIAFERELRSRQAARGHVPPTKEEVDAYLEAERNSWDD